MKIDLTKVLEAKNATGTIAAIKSSNWSWESIKPDEGWIYPVYQSGGSGTGAASSIGTPSLDAEGNMRCTSAGGSNGRLAFPIPVGSTILLQTVIRYDNATRIIGRTTDTTNNNGSPSSTITNIFDITGTGTLIREDTFVVNRPYFHYIGIMTTSRYFTILKETRYRVL